MGTPGAIIAQDIAVVAIDISIIQESDGGNRRFSMVDMLKKREN